eukprot:1141242-Pelagomonas_calceolata.AAC.1
MQPHSANNPSKCKPQDLPKAAAMRISPPVSPYQSGSSSHVRGGGQAQSLGSSMTPGWGGDDEYCGSWVGRAKECGLDNSLVRPAQAVQVHRMLAIHVIKALLFAQFL